MPSDKLSRQNWTLRYRFRMDKPFNVDDPVIAVTIGGRHGTLEAREGTLRSADWVILRFDQFRSQDEARSFGDRLFEALLVGAVKGMIGLDLGKNKPSSQYSSGVKEAVRAKTGRIIMDDIHGALVYEDTGAESFPFTSATIEVHRPVEAFMTAISAEMRDAPSNNAPLLTACELIALSLMSSDPLARGTMCMSAIELLAAKPWTESQRTLLRELQAHAEAKLDMPPGEAKEVSDAMQNVFKSIRQGLKRLVLDELKMGKDAWQELDDLYTLRSKIFHGRTGFDPDSNREFGDRTWRLSSQIVSILAAGGHDRV